MESRFGKKSLGGIALALFASLVVLGCASAPAADPLLMEKFVPALTVSEGETLVYVLRQKTYAGSALPLYVGVDDKIVADLDMGTYTFFKLPRGIHTVSAEQSVPLSWIRLDNRDEDVIFIYFKYETGELTELDAGTGKTTVMKYKPCKPMETEYGSSALADSLVNPSLVGLDLMKESGAEMKPDAESAVVTFYREKGTNAQRQVSIWGDREFLGTLPVRSQFSVKLPAGRHLFYTGIGTTDDDTIAILKDPTKKTGKNTWVTADLAAGKRYFVRLDVGLSGSFGYQVALSAAKADAATKATVASLKALVTDSARIDETVRARLEAAKTELAKKTSDDIAKLLFSRPLNLNPADGME
jgi:hypothetical protein